MSDDEHEQPQPQDQQTLVSMKLSPFWLADPQIWFTQVEAQFSTHRITSQWIMLSPPEYATEIRDLILEPPDDHPSIDLKFN